MNTRFAAYITGGNNDLCTHVWIDSTADQLKAELARIKTAFDKAVATKKGKKVYDKKGFLSAEHVGGYNLSLCVGSSTHPEFNYLITREPYESFFAVGVSEELKKIFPNEDSDLPPGLDPNDWDEQQDDDYSIRVTEKGIHFVIQTGWDDHEDGDEPEMDESPVIPWDFIR